MITISFEKSNHVPDNITGCNEEEVSLYFQPSLTWDVLTSEDDLQIQNDITVNFSVEML